MAITMQYIHTCIHNILQLGLLTHLLLLLLPRHPPPPQPQLLTFENAESS